jgi:hypothetical protein
VSSPFPRLRAHLTWLEQHWQDYRDTCDDIAPAELRSTAAGAGRATGHSDPTPTIALVDTGYHGTLEGIQGAVAQLDWCVQQVQAVITRHGAIAREREQLKPRITCDGSFDPLCGRIAAPDRGGKCHQCWMDARKRLNDASTLHTTPKSGTSDYDSRSLSLVRHASTSCLLCGQTFAASGTDEEAIRADVTRRKAEHTCTA